MEYLLIIAVLLVAIYFFKSGLSVLANQINDSIEISALEAESENQDKIYKIEKRIGKVIKKNDGWIDIAYLDDMIETNIKIYKKV